MRKVTSCFSNWPDFSRSRERERDTTKRRGEFPSSYGGRETLDRNKSDYRKILAGQREQQPALNHWTTLSPTPWRRPFFCSDQDWVTKVFSREWRENVSLPRPSSSSFSSACTQRPRFHPLFVPLFPLPLPLFLSLFPSFVFHPSWKKTAENARLNVLAQRGEGSGTACNQAIIIEVYHFHSRHGQGKLTNFRFVLPGFSGRPIVLHRLLLTVAHCCSFVTVKSKKSFILSNLSLGRSPSVRLKAASLLLITLRWIKVSWIIHRLCSPYFISLGWLRFRRLLLARR